MSKEALTGGAMHAILRPIMNISQYQKERTQVAAFMTRLYDRQLTTASGGNISLRISDELFCITPSALDKGKLTFEDIAVGDHGRAESYSRFTP